MDLFVLQIHIDEWRIHVDYDQFKKHALRIPRVYLVKNDDVSQKGVCERNAITSSLQLISPFHNTTNINGIGPCQRET